MKILYKVLSWIIAFVVPVVVVLFVVRLVINPWYLIFEYHTPGFPDDPYGFSLADRLNYGKLAVDYLVNDSDISFLSDLRFPPGQQAPDASCQSMKDCSYLYNERELGHMLDVKNVVNRAMDVLIVGFGLLIGLGVWSWLGKWETEYFKGLQRGSLLLLALIGLIILSVLIMFNYIFVLFHQIFFTAGTWSFLYSDTLIRLFPERFWQDTFLMVGGLSVVFGLLIYFGAGKIRRKRQNN
jgi:integral membrane protein (TIGR01906 family)